MTDKKQEPKDTEPEVDQAEVDEQAEAPQDGFEQVGSVTGVQPLTEDEIPESGR